MSNLSRNISKLLRERGLSQSKLASLSDVDSATISRILNGSATLVSDSLGKLAVALNVTPAQLLAPDLDVPSNIELLPRGLQKIRLIDTILATAPPGAAHEFLDEQMEEYLYVNSEYAEETFATRVADDSMIPDFYPDNVIIVDPTISPKPGQFVVAIIGEKIATLKKYASRGFGEDGSEIFELLSSNPVHASFRSDHVPIRIIGVAREKIEKLP